MTSTRTPPEVRRGAQPADPHADTHAGPHADPSWPYLLFENHSALQALHYDTANQHGHLYHVVVVKARYALGQRDEQGRASLVPSAGLAPLNDTDLPYDAGDLVGSVREESDLAPYKPRCDVLVTGHAHAPGGQAAASFTARLLLREPDRPAELPAPPQGLNPLQPAPAQALEDWRARVQRLRATPQPGATLIDKTLRICGPREWVHASVLPSMASMLTLGIARPSPWQLSAPQPVVRCPLRYELAYGGECRINAGDEAAARVPAAARLTAQQQAQHPDAQAPQPQRPVAHEASPSNPVGRGYARQWYLQARRLQRLPAHQIELAGQPVDGSDFWRVARGGQAPLPAGFSPVGRPWQPRLRWVGTQAPSAEKIGAGFALNEDFDFRYWNGAPEDQQCRHLHGGEQVELTNLCPAHHPGSSTDAEGNTVLKFEVPRRELVLLGADAQANLAIVEPVIDTVLIDTDRGSVDICWRFAIDEDEGITRARLIEAVTPEQRQRLEQLRRAGPQGTSEPGAEAAAEAADALPEPVGR